MILRRLSKKFKDLTSRSPRLSATTPLDDSGAMFGGEADGVPTAHLNGKGSPGYAGALRKSTFLQFNAQSDAWTPIQNIALDAERLNVDLPATTSSGSAPLPLSATILSWNVWFSRHEQSARNAALLQTVLGPSAGPSSGSQRPTVDVACFQEVEGAFWQALRSNERIRAEWLLSDWDQQKRSNWYGTVIMLRRSFVISLATTSAGTEAPRPPSSFSESPQTTAPAPPLLGEAARAGSSKPLLQDRSRYTGHSSVCIDCEILPYANSQMGRQLLVARISRASADLRLPSADSIPGRDTLLVIATTHLESYDSNDIERREQIDDALGTLSSAVNVPTIWCGDTNIATYAELKPMLDNGFVDSLRVANPTVFDGVKSESDPSADGALPTYEATEPLYRSMPTFGTTFKTPDADKRSKRIDYMLVRGASVYTAALVGDQAIDGVQSEESRDGKLYPSDHLGIWASVGL